ncbi:MAG: hypothetical protein Q8Q48_00935 [Candidatus Staskawiczbacteria bacterium]|nr:hypothetical protein [Candidatus Staskawiczbacteria bacterium]
MIKKIFEKFFSSLLVILALLGLVGFSSARTKEIKKETILNDIQKERTLSIEKPKTDLFYKNYDKKRIEHQLPESGQMVAMVSMSGTNSIVIATVDFDYTANTTNTTVTIKDVDLLEPKSLLARNSNEELEENIDFYSNYSGYPRKI